MIMPFLLPEKPNEGYQKVVFVVYMSKVTEAI